MSDKVLTPEQVGKMLQIHPLTVLRYIKAKKIKASRLGRVYRIKEESVEAFLDKQSQF